jgi:hypothetical protein
MPGYSRSFNKTPGDLIDSVSFNNEYTTIESAFNSSAGHAHNGALGNGAYVAILSDADNKNEILVNKDTNQIVLSIEVGGVKTPQLVIAEGVLFPSTTAYTDLGSLTNKIKDLHVGGTANLTTLVLNTGTSVTGIFDDDTMAANSPISLPTQRSTKTYVDNRISTHVHDGVESPLVATISSGDTLNTVTIDAGSSNIVFSTNDGGIKTTKLKVGNTAIFPNTNLGMDLGQASTNKFGNAYVGNLVADALEISSTVPINKVLNEGTLVSNDPAALATQSSIKTYVDSAIGSLGNITLNGGFF